MTEGAVLSAAWATLGAAVVLAQARPARVAPPAEPTRGRNCWQANAQQRIARSAQVDLPGICGTPHFAWIAAHLPRGFP